MRITVITPTLPNRSAQLRRMQSSCKKYLLDGDEHLIVVDGIQATRIDVGGLHSTRVAQKVSGDSTWGNIQRDYAAMLATGDVLVYCDDDDVLMPEAIEYLHSLDWNPERCYLFRMRVDIDTVLDTERYQEMGHIGGPQIVVPNRDDLPRWCLKNERSADYWFIQECIKRYQVVHRPEIICHVRP